MDFLRLPTHLCSKQDVLKAAHDTYTPVTKNQSITVAIFETALAARLAFMYVRNNRPLVRKPMRRRGGKS
jgi:hypothetical protein